MASITGTTAGSMLAAASSKRMSGLASGLDTDQLVESMTAATRAKIAKAEQNKTKTQWRMDAYRSISSKLIAFQNKFTSYISASNLRGSALFSRSIITASGEYSKYVKASGNGNNAGNVSIAGVAQLARSTSYVSKEKVSANTLKSTAEITASEVDVSKLAGQSFSFQYDNKDFSITLDAEKDYQSVSEVVDEINKQLAQLEFKDGKKMGSQIAASYEGGQIKLDYANDEAREAGKTMKITAVSGNIDSTLGIQKDAELTGSQAITGKAVSDSDIKDAHETIQKYTTDVSRLAGQGIAFKYNNKTFSITLDSSKEYKTVDDVVEELNKKLAATDYSSGKKLDSQLAFSVEDGRLKLDFKDEDIRKIGNTLEVTGVSAGFESTLGIKKGAKLTGTQAIKGKAITDSDIEKAYDTKNMIDVLAGKKFSFSYNGKTASITLGSAAELAATDADGNVDLRKLDMEKVRDSLQKGLEDAFGSGRIQVDWNKDGSNKLEFRTTKPDGSNDDTSTLSLTSGDSTAMKALKMESGASNRLNQNAALAKSGFNFHTDISKLTKDEATGRNDYAIRIKDNITGQEYVIDKTINGVAFDEDTTMDEIIRAINNSEAKVQVTYLSTSDRLSITSKQDGASGNFSIVGSDDPDEYNLGEAIFGKKTIQGTDVDTDGADYTITKGQDAIIYVDFDGEGGEEPVQISRGSNTFDLNGMTVTVNGIFNVSKKDDGSFALDKDYESVTFDTKPDVDKLTTAVKEMVDAYNEIIELANKMVSEKPNRKFSPLTAEQKAEMSDDDIANWNEKAQAGLLFNDIDLRNFTSEIRFLFGTDSASIAAWEKVGIASSTSYSDNGKITFDESAFRAAVESDLDGVKDLFTAQEASYIDERGNRVVTQRGGVMTNIKTIFDKYAGVEGATKGLFVQQAGAVESPLSVLDNALQKQMDEYDDLIDSLNDKLQDEIEKYYNKFASLETYINNMNTQSSWLTQQFSNGN